MIARQPFLAALALCLWPSLDHAASYQYFRIGNQNNIHTVPAPGTAMMGGGKDLDEAFRWLCNKAGGGDFLILRAAGDDAYNSYVNQFCTLNSVATLVIPDRQAAQDPTVVEIIRNAAAVFISGGDQGHYIRAWGRTPVHYAINANIAAQKPIGGSSAGLAVLGAFAYSALADPPDANNLASSEVLNNPYAERVTLVRGFLKIPNLDMVLTDSHFAKRDRMGRSLGFLARIMQDHWSTSPKEVAIDEKSAFLVEPDGNGTVVGSGNGAYFIRPTRKPAACKKGAPLTLKKISVYKVPSGGHFALGSWTGTGGTTYSLSVNNGAIDSTQPNHAIY